MGLDFVHSELIGFLWFAIGRSHASDRLSPPSRKSTRHHQRRDVITRGM